MLGDVSKKYESGNRGPGVISTGRGDPGGKSYGPYQLASKTGTLGRYIEGSIFRSLQKLKLGSREFDREWKRIAKEDPIAFAEDQRQFIQRTHYDPVRRLSNALGIPDTEAINEALFSIGVQHGRAIAVVNKAMDILGSIKGKNETQIVRALYTARRQYVLSLRLSTALKRVLLRRYDKEEKDVLRLI